MVDMAVDLATREPIDPRPDSPFAPSWSIPGAGGELRGGLRDHLLTGVGPRGEGGVQALPRDIALDELKRVYKAAFFLRCLDECFEAHERMN